MTPTLDSGETYRTDVLYVPYCTHMLSPAFMRFALLLRGYDFPAPLPPPLSSHGAHTPCGEPFRYLELGFGMGKSLVANAAATGGEFWGVDFLEGHCDAARKSAEELGVGGRVRILQKTFAQVAERAGTGECGSPGGVGIGGESLESLPFFDVIALHGVWSWVDAANREHILRIVRSRLKPGGVLYVSYNALPGWAIFLPLRDAMLGMMADSARAAPDAGAEAWIRAVMERLVGLAESDGAYFRLNPLCGTYLAEMAKKPPAFLAHDFCNPVWQPFSFREVAEDFASAGCGYAASGDLFHHVDAFLPPGIAERVREADAGANAVMGAAAGVAHVDLFLGETLRDLALNTQFRVDLFLRSGSLRAPERLDAGEFRRKLGDAAVSLVVLPEIIRELPLALSYGLNKMRLDDALCRSILGALAEKGDLPVRIGDLPGGIPDSESDLRCLIDCLAAMREAGYIREA